MRRTQTNECTQRQRTHRCSVQRRAHVTVQSDETGDLGPDWGLTRTRTLTNVIEVQRDDQQSKEDVLDMIRIHGGQ
jgi:hypothetical protein